MIRLRALLVTAMAVLVLGAGAASAQVYPPPPPPPPPPPAGFVDVPASAYYALPVNWAKANGVTTGVGGSNRFEPLRAVTRAEAITFLWRAQGRPSGGSEPFIDVPSNAWFTPAVRWAYRSGITTGVGGTNRFEPHRPITRAEMVTFMWRAAGKPSAGSSGFVDVPAGSYYAAAVAWAKVRGITTGIGGSNRFEPVRAVLRAEAVTFLYRRYG